MTFNTIEFFTFLLAFVLLYYLLPVKARNVLLLVGSYFFYGVYAPALLSFLVAITLVNYGAALAMARHEPGQPGRRRWLVFGLILDIGVLAFYKYFNFFSLTLNRISGSGDALTLNLLVPLGISFITFSVASYLIDVYRGTIMPERRFFRFALYVAFFPKAVQGPIERAGNILPQFDEEHRFDLTNLRIGVLMVLFGTFMKMVVADRAAIVVNTVYANLNDHSGAAVLLAAMMFSLQIYYDFAGYIGVSRMLGFRLLDNFRQPYLAATPAAFWRRWHISLTTWLRDYLYIPLGGSRCSRGRKWYNTLVTFGLSGLWHGADWGFVIWGLANGALVAVEADIRKMKKSILTAKGKPTDKKPGPILTFLLTVLSFMLLTFTWVFFRAQTLALSTKVFERIFTHFRFMNLVSSVKKAIAAGEGAKLYGLDVQWGWTVLLAGMLIVAVVDLLLQKVKLSEKLAEDRKTWLRWIVFIVLFMSIVIFGVYGYGYEAASFIYADF